MCGVIDSKGQQWERCRRRAKTYAQLLQEAFSDKPTYVKPVGKDATGLIYTSALHSAGHINLVDVRDDVYQEEEAQAARDAAKEQQ